MPLSHIHAAVILREPLKFPFWTISANSEAFPLRLKLSTNSVGAPKPRANTFGPKKGLGTSDPCTPSCDANILPQSLPTGVEDNSNPKMLRAVTFKASRRETALAACFDNSSKKLSIFATLMPF
jgi:hypothetical protein